MQSKFYFYLSLGFLCTILPLFGSLQQCSSSFNRSQDQLIQATASLLYYINECNSTENLHSPIEFTQDDVQNLWNKVYQSLCNPQLMQYKTDFELAHHDYQQAHYLLSENEKELAKPFLNRSTELMSTLWHRLTNDEMTIASSIARNIDNPHTKLKAHQIPDSHPMKVKMDALFLNQRVTLNRETYENAGFSLLQHHRSNAFITIARHPSMPGYLVKAYMDDQLQTKRGFPSWKWLVQRCEGAKKIQSIITKKKIKHFTVASKWIYILPNEPAPPKSPQYIQHLAVLLVTDMNLIDDRYNKEAWRTKMTEEHLDELYYIISRARGSSYRADNIPYTNNGQFAFIDTEYPNQKPNFESVRRYLNSKMARYWDKIVKRGG